MWPVWAGPSLIVKHTSAGEGAGVRGGFLLVLARSAVCESDQWDWGMGPSVGLWRASS